VVSQFTLFTSILSEPMKNRMAAEMIRVLKPGGVILWYDFRFNNPRNQNVRGIESPEITSLFPGCSVTSAESHPGAAPGASHCSHLMDSRLLLEKGAILAYSLFWRHSQSISQNRVDCVVSAVGLLLLSPVMLIAALAVALGEGMPCFSGRNESAGTADRFS